MIRKTKYHPAFQYEIMIEERWVVVAFETYNAHQGICRARLRR
jgi:hypothetical protein